MACLLIANPHGGGGAAERRVRALLRGWPANAEPPRLRWTEAAGHAVELAAEAREPLVVAVGGDGTVHEVVQGLMRRAREERPTLGLLPAGSGNSLARDLGLLDPARAAAALHSGRDQPLDVAELRWPDGRRAHAFNIVGWALGAEVGRLAERLRGLGRARYDLAALLAIARHRPRAAELVVDGETLAGPWSLLHLANTRFTGAGLELLPEARVGDGLLDVLAVRARSRAALLRDLVAVRRGRGFGEQGVVRRRARRVALRVADADGLPLNVDGELLPPPPVELELLPAALRVRA